MSKDEARTLFSKVYRADDQPDTEEAEYTIAVTQLVEELGFLPLAIIQAAAYTRETQDDISSYISMYKQTREVETRTRKRVYVCWDSHGSLIQKD